MWKKHRTNCVKKKLAKFPYPPTSRLQAPTPTNQQQQKKPKIYSTSIAGKYIFSDSLLVLYTLSRKRETKRTREPLAIARTAAAKPGPAHFFYLLTNCEPHPSHTESVIASISSRSAAAAAATHSEINIKYCLQRHLPRTYRAACRRTDGPLPPKTPLWNGIVYVYLVKALKPPFNQELTAPNICSVNRVTAFPLYLPWLCRSGRENPPSELGFISFLTGRVKSTEVS